MPAAQKQTDEKPVEIQPAIKKPQMPGKMSLGLGVDKLAAAQAITR
jgi:hypothetical protein